MSLRIAIDLQTRRYNPDHLAKIYQKVEAALKDIPELPPVLAISAEVVEIVARTGCRRREDERR